MSHPKRMVMLEERAEMGQSKSSFGAGPTLQEDGASSKVDKAIHRSTIPRALQQNHSTIEHGPSAGHRRVTDGPTKLPKRSRDEMERVDDDVSSPPRRRRSSSPKSPPNLRQSFIPDRGDYWSPENSRRRDYIASSPTSPPWSYRGLDRYVPSTRRSPSPRRRPSPTRSSPDRRPSSHINERTQPHPGSPPLASRPHPTRQDSDSHAPRFVNLTWKAAVRPPAERSVSATTLKERVADTADSSILSQTSAERAADDIQNVKVDFNGLTGVPTGPKRMAMGQSDMAVQVPPDAPNGPKGAGNKALSRIDLAVLRSPHIFISSKWLPASTATVKHLRGCLGQLVPKNTVIFVDELGYYICFKDTDDGLNHLEQCHTARNEVKLFSQYILHMERFPHGNWSSEPHPSTEFAQILSSDDVEAMDTEAAADPTTHQSVPASGFNQRPLGDVPTESQISRHLPVSRPSITSTANGDSPISPPIAAVHSLRSSSPLRIPSRQDRDSSSSSISGFTDGSTFRKSKCHVCKAASPFEDMLILCSSCPRRYHHRCHTRPEIPKSLGPDHSWQCRRCVKKQVRPKSKLSNASLAGDSPAPSVGQTEEPPFKKPRILATVEPESPYEPSPANDVSKASSAVVAPEPPIDHQPHNHAAQKDVSPMIDSAKPLMGSDDINFQDADELVAQSFTLPPLLHLGSVNVKKSGGKLNLMRKKLNQSPSSGEFPVTQTQQDSSTTIEASITTDLDRENSSTPEESTSKKDALSRKMKSHKWVGGGADKDIISAGKESSFFASWVPSEKLHNNPTDVVLEPEARLEKAGANPEDEKIDSLIDDNLSAHAPEELVSEKTTDMLATDKSKAQTPQERSDEIAAVSAEVSGSRLSRPKSVVEGESEEASSGLTSNVRVTSPVRTGDGSVPQPGSSRPTKTGLFRPMPSKLKWDYCTKCKKPTRYNPADPSKALCLACQGVRLEEPAIDVSTLNTAQDHDVPVLPSQNSRDDDEQAADGDDIAAGATAKAISNVISALELPVELSESNVIDMNAQTKLRKACDDCRRKHKTCPHRISAEHVSKSLTCDDCRRKHISCKHRISAVEQNSTAARDMDKSYQAREDNLEAESPEDSLNFWESGTKPANSLSRDSSLSLEPETKNQSESGSQSPERSEEEDNTAKAKSLKRKSQTRPARYENDLGDSFTRPKNSYVKLIAMALGEAPGNALKSVEILQWVYDNIKEYKKGEGNWENSIRAILSMNRLMPDGTGFWEKIVPKDATNKNPSCWYKLLPNIPETELRWDPVLKKPASPLRIKISGQDGTNAGPATYEDILPLADRTPTGLSPVKQTSRKNAQHQTETARHDLMEIDVSREDVSESSDEEPLSERKRSNVATQQAISTQKDGQAITDLYDAMDVDSGVSVGAAKADTALAVLQPREKPREVSKVDPICLLQLIKADVKENVDFSARSLFEEWPEYDPVNQLDTEARIADIKKRPTRKQRFGKPSQDPWIDERIANRPPNLHTHRSKAKRSAGTDFAYAWEHGSVIKCKTVEDLFNLPNNPMAIMHEGQLAYRDGTRNDDGSLPRAKVLFKTTGYL